MKIALFNDTGNIPHVGCQGVSDAHARMLSRAGATVAYRYHVDELHDVWQGDRAATQAGIAASELADVIRSVDAVVVNGEGTIHHGAGLHLLAILDFALSLKKGAFLVNAVLQEVREYGDVLGRLNDLTVRERRSATYAATLGARPRLVADSILEAEFEDGVDECYRDKIIVTDCHHLRRDVRQQLNLIQEIFEDDAVFFPLETEERFSDWRRTLCKFRAARLVVTGRHHGVYLALMAQAHFVALPSNTWKVESLLELLGAMHLLWRDEPLVNMVSKSIRNPASNKYVLDNEFLVRPLSTFRLLEGLR